MKYISYDAIKKWKSNDLADIIDVTDDKPEEIKREKSKEEELDWLQYVHLDRYYDETTQSETFQQQIIALYREMMDTLQGHFNKKYRNLKRFMRDSGTYSHQTNYLYQLMFNYARYRLRHFYQPSYDYFSNYEIYTLQNAFSGEDWGVVQEIVQSFIEKLPPASSELRELFKLTQYGTEELWWDMDGNYRHQRELSQKQANIMNSTKPRNSKPWKGEYRDEIVDLYLSYWDIILDTQLESGPTRSAKRNFYFNKVGHASAYPSEENRYHKIISSLIKIAENTVRKKHKIREIKIEADEDNISRRFRKEVYEKIIVLNQKEFKVMHEKQPKVIRLSKRKISSSQAELSTVVDLITDFVGEEASDISEKVIEPVNMSAEELKSSSVVVEDDTTAIYKLFIQGLVETESVSQKEATEFCRENGFLLNAFINNLNQFLYDFIDDQVVVNEGDQIVIDEFYVDEMKELVANGFEES